MLSKNPLSTNTEANVFLISVLGDRPTASQCHRKEIALLDYLLYKCQSIVSQAALNLDIIASQGAVLFSILHICNERIHKS